MFNTNDVFDEKTYPRDQSESFIYFLKRYEFLIDLTPLHSKARASNDRKIIKEALKHFFVPTDLIREYYGD